MSIFYILVAKRNDMILVDYTDYSGNFQQIKIDIMKRIEPDTQKTFELSDYHFHFNNEKQLTVCDNKNDDMIKALKDNRCHMIWEGVQRNRHFRSGEWLNLEVKMKLEDS